jgi:hypothetical protein
VKPALVVALAAVTLALAASACRRSPGPAPEPAASASTKTDAAAIPVSSDLPAAASAGGQAAPATSGAPVAFRPVSHDAFGPRVLYTWTTAEQLAELRRDPTLLRRSRSARGKALFDEALERDTNPISKALVKALAQAKLTRRRFAWPSPWATVVGPEDERYGDRLVRVELRPEAILARFSPGSSPRWRFVDKNGQLVPTSTVITAPERLGAILHESPATATTRAFREFVLVSEAMIASWSLETAAIDAEIAASIDALERHDPGPEAALPAGEWAARVPDAWRSAPAASASASGSASALPAPPPPAYEASLAFAIEAYHPDPEHRAALLTALRAARAPAGSARPFEHRPAPPVASPFPDLTEPGVQKQNCVRHGTFVRCAPLPPSSRRAHDGRFCADPDGHMIDCPPR